MPYNCYLFSDFLYTLFLIMFEVPRDRRQPKKNKKKNRRQPKIYIWVASCFCFAVIVLLVEAIFVWHITVKNEYLKIIQKINQGFLIRNLIHSETKKNVSSQTKHTFPHSPYLNDKPLSVHAHIVPQNVSHKFPENSRSFQKVSECSRRLQ